MEPPVKPPFQEDEYHRVLFDLYIEVIRQSGLLLDEDLEILVNQYESDEQRQFPKYKPSMKLKLSLGCLFGSVMLTRKYSKWVVLPSVLLATASACLEMRNAQIKEKQKELAGNLINICKKINYLYSSIKKFFQIRKEIESKSREDFFKSHNKDIEAFLNKQHQQEIIFFNNIINSLEFFVNYSNSLVDDYNFIKNFTPFEKDVPVFDTTDICINYLSHIQDIHVWLTSKLLSYICTLLLPSNKLNKSNIHIFMKKNLPTHIRTLSQHYEVTKRLFYSLKKSIIKRNELKNQKTKPSVLPNKLQNTLLSAVDNISVLSEKSYKILEEVENSCSQYPPAIEFALLDLRSHTFAVYESLDLLCKLYGILSSRNVPRKTKIVKDTKVPDDDTIVTVHHDDNVEALEEHFELYLEKDFIPSEEPSVYIDDSGEYINLMLQELRQSLKKHERFIEAKKKRGSVEEEEEVVEIKEKCLPKFDLSALDKHVENIEDNSESNTVKDVFSPPRAPPIPPPLPEGTEFNLSDNTKVKHGSKLMLESIRALSSQLRMQEEIFGESMDDEEEN